MMSLDMPTLTTYTTALPLTCWPSTAWPTLSVSAEFTHRGQLGTGSGPWTNGSRDSRLHRLKRTKRSKYAQVLDCRLYGCYRNRSHRQPFSSGGHWNCE